MSGDDSATAFGRLLRRRRTRRNVSQEELARRADLSPRHVSFLETGRSNPSRGSVLSVAEALDLPLRDRNALLRAAGFAAVYPDRDLLASGDSRVRRLFEFLLRRHEPFPAFVVDRAWAVRMHNRAAVDLLAWLLGGDAEEGEGVGGGRALPSGRVDRRRVPAGDDGSGPGDDHAAGRVSSRLVGTNLLRVLFDPDGLRPLTVNFEEVAGFLWDRLEEEIALRPDDEGLEELRRDLDALGPVPDPTPEPPREEDPPALPVHLRKDGRDLRLLSFLMTVAAPREVGLQEIRMETFLPADGESEDLLRELRDR